MMYSVTTKGISTLIDSPHVEGQSEETVEAGEEANDNVPLCPHCVLLS